MKSNKEVILTKFDLHQDYLDKIQEIVAESDEYIVYLDKDMMVQWNISNKYQGRLFDGFGDVVNRMKGLQIKSFFIFPNGLYKKNFQYLLGESIVRLLSDQNINMADNILNEAEKMLQLRGAERAKVYYLTSSLFVAICAVIFALIMWIMRIYIYDIVGKTAFILIFSSLLGSVGSIISIFSRLKQMSIDIFAQTNIYVIEGALRIIIGIFSALLCAVSIKANVLLGFINSSNFSLSILLTACIVSGASERFIPDLIKQVEQSFLSKKYMNSDK